MARIFLSHASPDKPAVRRIADALRAAGHDPWFDEEQIDVGDSIPAAVQRGLRESDFVVLCLSAVSAARGWVEAERDATLMQQFSQRQVRILPVRLEDVDPPYIISQLAYSDLFPGAAEFDAGMRRLVRGIEKHAKAAAAAKLQGGGSAGAQGGGSAGGAPAPTIAPSSPETVDVFVSFAPADASFLAELEKSIVLLKRENLVRVLHRGRIGPGSPADATVAAQLNVARLILVLVSHGYLASDDCYEREMKPALMRQDAGKAQVIPILVRECDEWKRTPLGGLVPLPRDGRPVDRWPSQDEAWSHIATQLRDVVGQILGLPAGDH